MGLESTVALAGIAIGFGLFALLLVLQILCWKLLRVKRQILGLFFIYFALPTIFFYCLPFSLEQRFVVPYLCVFYYGLAMAYVISFPAIQAESPSLGLLLLLRSRHDTGGWDEKDLVETYAQKSLLQDRLDDLRNDGLTDAGGRISFAGRLLARVFLAYRSLIRQHERNG